MSRSLRAIMIDDGPLLLRAGLRLLLVRLGVWLFPLGTVRRLLDGTPRGGVGRWDADPPDRTAWAVAALGRRLPAMTCLIEAIALQTLLAGAGHAATLRIGVRRDGGAGAARRLRAHAWVEYDGRVLIGSVPDLAAYATLSVPDERSRGWVWER